MKTPLSKQNRLNYNAAVSTPLLLFFYKLEVVEKNMSLSKINPIQRFSYLQTGVILQKCAILPLRRFEFRSYEIIMSRGYNLG